MSTPLLLLGIELLQQEIMMIIFSLMTEDAIFW
jgi:hypothetical protein